MYMAKTITKMMTRPEQESNSRRIFPSVVNFIQSGCYSDIY